MSKVFVLGIDGAEPEYIFKDWINELPNIKKLMQQGIHGKLNSAMPPLTAVAWTSMVTGKSSADLGFFEYVYRKNYSYEHSEVISAKNVKEKTLWQIASDNGKKSVVCLVPLTWPIKPFNGELVSGFMTPSTDSEYTYPKELKQEINKLFNNKFSMSMSSYECRHLPDEDLIKRSYEITEMHFKLIKHLLQTKEWDLFFGVILETDAMNHKFLRYYDKRHRKYDENSKFKNVLKEYYKYIDRELGEILDLLDEDTTVVIASDHGMNRMHTRVNLSDWLIKQGYLVLKDPVKEKTKLNIDMVDWKKTKAWAIGAYEGQIFINLKGREPEGTVEESEYVSLVNELEAKLKRITGDDGAILNTKIFKRGEHIKGKYENLAPDMIIYFDELRYGCNTSLIKNDTLWSPQTAVGSDDAGHALQGIFIIKDNKNNKEDLQEFDILDITPTILNKLGVPIPPDMRGKVISE